MAEHLPNVVSADPVAISELVDQAMAVLHRLQDPSKTGPR
jgi:hypothetical protein